MGDRGSDALSGAGAWGDPASGAYFASADGTDIWYADTGGPGEAVVYLHGFSGSSSAAGHFADRVSASGLRFIAPDLRGHGLSAKPAGEGAYRLDRFVDDFTALLDEAAVRRAHLVGHCMGGMVATACAAALPERVETLTLVGTSMQPTTDQRLAGWAKRTSPAWVRWLARGAFPAKTDSPAHVDYSAFTDTGDWYWRRMVADYRALSAEAGFAILESLRDLDLLDTARAVGAHSLVVHGAGDSVFPRACAERTVAALRDARLLILPNDNHISLVLQADSALFGATIDFVSGPRPQ